MLLAPGESQVLPVAIRVSNSGASSALTLVPQRGQMVAEPRGVVRYFHRKYERAILSGLPPFP